MSLYLELKALDWRNIPSWPRRIRSTVLVMIAVVAWLLSFLLIDLGQYTSLSAARQTENELKQNLATAIPSIVTQKQEKLQLLQIQRLIQQQNRGLANLDQLGTVLDDITQATTDNRLDLVLLKPNPAVPVEPYMKIPIEVTVNGDYVALARFLNQLAHLPYYLYPSQFKLSPQDSSKTTAASKFATGALNLQMFVDMYTMAPTKDAKA